ncbi:ribosome-binding factor A [Deferribacter desulfuricans SSM1]|uniref:Ribosome-binding factor A n=1 Tax=Deferribacter desulfuricans (strain DSM 14783 / JCM 11476 / NBRC 101012 / SSM1) TaxID=639282 RepID=D3PEG0_DEFDS|nr:30S ribosome-binding factor RbfA [Deferribacter desulfuricans]BAI80983.1 ribosome-binding factor A [Deferribacter desulfuricans SSM1]
MEKGYRARRVSELIREELSKLIIYEVKDPLVKSVIITAVKVSNDLSLAKIYFRSYDLEMDLNDVLKGLNRSKGFLRENIKKSLRLKKIPSLEFYIDDVVDEGLKIDNIIKKLHDS